MRVRRRAVDRSIFFPWEGKGGFIRWLRVGRIRPAVLVGVVAGFMLLVGYRERRAAGVRQTRAIVLDARRAIDAYLAEHDGGCPDSLAVVSQYAHFDGAPRDAWGRPLRLICPGKREGTAYELMSDGPDGKPGGRDRIE
jgi:general secretion pathway protein G